MSRHLITLVAILFFYSCQKEFSLEQGPLSRGSLQNNLGECLPKGVNGSYAAGQALTDSNFIEVGLDITQTGSYTIHTDTVNGYSFKVQGSFSDTGTNTVRLKAAGKPLAAGEDVFTVFFDSSSCVVRITVLPGGTTPAPSGDHFILTDNSWWSYSTPAGAGDTLKRSISGAVSAGGVPYKVLKEKNVTGAIDDSSYVRKSGNNYYEISRVDRYTTFQLDKSPIDSLLFLKEGLNTGDTWSSQEYADAVNGTPTKVKYVYTCTNANATVTLNGQTYTSVYQVTLKVQKSQNNGPYTDDVTWINYYAQGIGWIYQKYDDGTSAYELPIRYYQVF